MKLKSYLLLLGIILFTVLQLVSADVIAPPTYFYIFPIIIVLIINFIINLFLIWLVLKLLVGFSNFKKVLLGTLIITVIGLIIDILSISLTTNLLPSLIYLFFVAGILLFIMYYLMAKFFFKIEKCFWFALIMALLTNPAYLIYLFSHSYYAKISASYH